MTFQWARRVKRGEPYCELSTKGDIRFSALNARLKDGRTIEEAYQLDVKGYRALGNDWKIGKGKDPIHGALIPDKDRHGSDDMYDRLYEAYLGLWQQWASENPALIEELKTSAEGKTITDMFATSPISQARALCDILNQQLTLDIKAEKKPEKFRLKF